MKSDMWMIHATFHMSWANPWDKDNCSTESVFEIMESAASKYASYMIKMADALDDAFEVIEDNSPAILEMLCNNSYNSGLDCRKSLNATNNILKAVGI